MYKIDDMKDNVPEGEDRIDGGMGKTTADAEAAWRERINNQNKKEKVIGKMLNFARTGFESTPSDDDD